MGVSREELYRLIRALPEAELLPVLRFLEFLRSRTGDPLLYALATAPADDEPVSEPERKAIQEADEAIANGEVTPLEEVARRVLKEAR